VRDITNDRATTEETSTRSALDTVLAVWSRRKWIAVLAFAIPMAAGVGFVTFLPNLYRSTATILVDRQQVPEAFVRSTVTSALETRLMATQPAACLPPETDMGTLSADNKTCIYASGVTVTFTGPSSGARGTFAGGTTTATATTNSSGVATAPTFTANGTTGTYTVTATVSECRKPPMSAA